MSTVELVAEFEILSVEDYLAGETESEVRHEYFGGEVTAMAGASDVHERISGNLFAALHQHLKGGPCQVYKDGMKVKLKIRTEDVFYYPDIMVACEPGDNERYYREQPKLIVEILSEDKNKDRIEKYFAYQQIPSLEEYVIVSQDLKKPKVEVFRRADDWQLSKEFTDGDFELSAVGYSMSVAELYE